jgi:chorismate-pyruvate lyase
MILSARGPWALCALMLSLALAHSESPPGTEAPPPGYVQRLEAALLLQTLNAALLSQDSATATLQRWCDVHHVASPAHITAERVRETDKPLTPAQREQLQLTATDEVRYRKVRLLCGGIVLSEADNWYVPARLTPQMNRQLETTDTPFGVVVQPLHFQRHTLSAELLWQPLPAGWEMTPPAAEGPGKLCFPAHVLQHRAVLRLSDGTPISEVVETYSSNLFAIARFAPVTPC